MSGESFASRVAGSLLQAVGLPELITHSLEQYEELAINLATNQTLLAQITMKLRNNTKSMPLFDSGKYVKNYEASIQKAYQNYILNTSAEHIEIDFS